MKHLGNKAVVTSLCCILILGILLTIILVPLSFSYVEYYEYGLNQRKSSGSVDTSQVYASGRYMVGPDYKFIKYQADAHYERLDALEVFSASGSQESIGLEFKVDVDFTFLLNRDEVGLLHQELAASYESIIVARAKDAIKNEAIYVTFEEYFQSRLKVEERFRAAVQRRWDEAPPLHCTLDQFHLGRIRIPDSVAEKQLESRVQNERNGMEDFLQQAQLEREQTAVEVNRINLKTEKVLRTAKAQADLARAKAEVEAKKIKANAQTNGTKSLFETTGIETQEHMTVFTYLRTLRNRENITLDISYLSSDNILKTTMI